MAANPTLAYIFIVLIVIKFCILNIGVAICFTIKDK